MSHAGEWMRYSTRKNNADGADDVSVCLPALFTPPRASRPNQLGGHTPASSASSENAFDAASPGVSRHRMPRRGDCRVLTPAAPTARARSCPFVLERLEQLGYSATLKPTPA